MSYRLNAFDRANINNLVDAYLDQMEEDVISNAEVDFDDLEAAVTPLMTYLMKQLNIAASKRGYNSLVSNGKK